MGKAELHLCLRERAPRSLPGTQLPNTGAQRSPFLGPVCLSHGQPRKDTQLFTQKSSWFQGGSKHPAGSGCFPAGA